MGKSLLCVLFFFQEVTVQVGKQASIASLNKFSRLVDKGAVSSYPGGLGQVDNGRV